MKIEDIENAALDCALFEDYYYNPDLQPAYIDGFTRVEQTGVLIQCGMRQVKSPKEIEYILLNLEIAPLIPFIIQEIGRDFHVELICNAGHT